MAEEDEDILLMKNIVKKPSKMSFFSKMAEEDEELIAMKAEQA